MGNSKNDNQRLAAALNTLQTRFFQVYNYKYHAQRW